MNNYKIAQIREDEYIIIRKLDRDAFEYNERDSNGDFHEVLADNIRRSPYYIPELDLVAVTDDGLTHLGHIIFSALPMGDNSKHIVWLHSLAVKHDERDNHTEKLYEYQHKGIGTALITRGLEIAKSLGYTGCMTCGHPDVYRKKMGFLDYHKLGIGRDDTVDDPEEAIHAVELVPGGFDKTNKLLSYAYYDFSLVEQSHIAPKTLSQVLSKMFGKNVIHASYQTKELHGGTLGDVKLVTGVAITNDGEKLPYKVVWKKQNKWERPGDPGSWRREYDLYISDLSKTFTNDFRWPACYHAEINAMEHEIQIWMEYIEGVSGNNLTVEMLEQSAVELGRFQGRLYSQPSLLPHLDCLSDINTTKKEYEKWYSEKDVLTFLCSEKCPFPEHICQMFFALEQDISTIFANIEKLPIVFAHKDCWVENIIYSNGKIRLIDWDTTGWGFLGEDIASLIIDETYTWYIEEYYKKLVPAYYKGFSEYADISFITDNCIYDMILIKFGYRLVRGYQYAKTDEHKEQHTIALQKIYEMKKMQ